MRLQKGRSLSWLPAALGARVHPASALRLVAPPPDLVEQMKIRRENEERSRVPPLPRREGVSGLPHRAAATGLGEASVAAPSLSLPMNAALTARSRKRRKERINSRSDHRNRHLSLVSPDPPASAGGGADDNGSSESAVATSRHSVASNQDVVVSGQSRTGSYTISARGTTDFELVVPPVDRQPLDPPAESGEQAQSATERPSSVDVHSSLRRKLDRLGCALLGWPANGLRVHVDLRPGVPEALGDRRPLASLGADPRGAQGARRVRGLWRSWLRAVAAYGCALWPEVEVSGREPKVESAYSGLASAQGVGLAPSRLGYIYGPSRAW